MDVFCEAAIVSSAWPSESVRKQLLTFEYLPMRSAPTSWGIGAMHAMTVFTTVHADTQCMLSAVAL